MITGAQWSADLLLQFGAIVTIPNVRFLNAWAHGESTRARFNPLATTRAMPGCWPFNSFGPGGSEHVWNYATYEDGLAATIHTLRNGRYPSIGSGLSAGAVQFSSEVLHELDVWGTGGAHVEAIYYAGPDVTWFPPSLVDAPAPAPLPTDPPALPKESNMVIIVSREHDTAYAVENGRWTEIDDKTDLANAMAVLPHFTWSAATIARVRGDKG